jgi:putative transposase
MRVEPDRRHLTLPVIGTVRVHENTRRLERLIRSDRARVLAISVRRNGTRLDASVRVLIQRPQQPRVALPNSRVGVDVGVRRLATIAAADLHVIEQVDNPRPLEGALKALRHASRARSRCTKGSRRYRERTTEMSRLHRRVNDVRTHYLHCLTTRLAKTHGRIVVEGLDAAGMLRQKGLPGARARRRGLSDAALGTPRRHLAYKTGWYGSALVVADRWFPSSKTCHTCGHVQDIGWDESGNAIAVRSHTSVMTTHPSTSHATRKHLASSAQLGPPSSVEPTVRPGPPRRVAVKRGRDAAARLPNHP